MAQVLKFQDAFGGREVETRRPEREFRAPVSRGIPADQRDDDSDDFWPEVCSRETPPTVSPENSPQRVLLEMFLTLAGVWLLVMATSLLVA